MNSEQLKRAKTLFFILLGVDIALTLGVCINAFLTTSALQAIHSGERVVDKSLLESLEFWDWFYRLIFISMIGVGLGLVNWLNACYRYAEDTLGASGFNNDSWFVIGWIIPVFNLFKPYLIVNEIYKVGAPTYAAPDAWKKEKSSGTLLTWGILWAATHLAGMVLYKQLMRSWMSDDITLQQAISMTEVQAWSCVVSLIVTALWYWVAEMITQRLLNRSSVANKGPAPAVAQ